MSAKVESKIEKIFSSFRAKRGKRPLFRYKSIFARTSKEVMSRFTFLSAIIHGTTYNSIALRWVVVKTN